jgi:hypothetical protein
VWASSVDDLDDPLVEAALVVVSNVEEIVAQAGAAGLFAGTGNVGSHGVPVGPSVRARLRGARGLPDSAILEFDGDRWWWQGCDIGNDDLMVDTALGCASAVAVTGWPVLRALAWAAPTVTDPETAALIGALEGMHVFIGKTTGQRRQVAASLAHDPVPAARLSWAGRKLVERRYDSGLVAGTLLRRLGISLAASLPGGVTMAARLEELGTPQSASVVGRVAMSTQTLLSA